ncbi:hypothetical protein WIV_gp146 [Wiseana iridescent virus]|uniref:Uncharacterized protein n=1 Tax=Wiseana iridescent virus TaxID=68347 RepID=G0T5H2_IRV9|nr:hypothetical protein WIV_gp146 [Wiseana iridescent virus]ADO00490.1 hypothetical protein [Wiseana iridescent virus]
MEITTGNKSRLTKEERQAVFQMRCNNVPITQIANKFKVSRPTIYSIIEMERKNQTKNDFFFEKEDLNKDMSNLISSEIKTTFLGVTIDTENGSSNPKINKALNTSLDLLDIVQFIKVTKFKINSVMFDYFWQVVVGNQCTLVGTVVLEWFGYEGEYRKQRQNFKKMLSNNNISYSELSYKDKEIELYPAIQEELQLLPHDGARACSKFLVMKPRDLKMAIMQLKTKNGHTIRDYYIDLEELLKMYTEYTLYFNHRKAQYKITNLEKMMVDLKLTNKNIEESNRRQEQYMRSLGISLEEVKDQNEILIEKSEILENQNNGLKKQNQNIQRKLGIAVEDRAPLPVDEKKQERFILIKRNDSEHFQYYTIRAQHGYTERRIKVQKTLFPHLQILLDFQANPNSKSLYTRIKDTLKAKNVQFSGNNIDLTESEVSEEELVEEMKVINDQRYNV